MLCIHLKNNDPYFCLASEEYLLKNFSEDIFMLWQSENAVVVGKHQNAAAEINHRFIHENNIAVCRRISGGGAVFHDVGNVNFTFIKNVKSPAEISFKIFTAPVVEALAKLGVTATTSGRNDLLINGLKISGNAEHVFKNRVLHHGTLLFSSDLKNLGQAIKRIPGKYESKAVQSNRSPVANISSFLKTPLNIDEFVHFLLNIQLEKAGTGFYELSETDIQIIQQLSKEKFKTWEWNFGYSPKYSFQNSTIIDGKKISVQIEVVKGIISEVKIHGNYYDAESGFQLEKQLQQKRHCFENVQQELKSISANIPGELIYVFF